MDRLAAFENVKKLAKESKVTSHEMAKKIAAEAQKGGNYDQKYIGDIIYGDRDDLGNGAEEGYNYLGRGFIQITGKANYAEYGKMLNIDLVGDPKRAADPDVAAKVAAEFWRVHGCNALADVDDVAAITLVITGDRAHSHDQFAVRRRLAEAGRFIWLNADAIPLPANNPMPDRMPGFPVTRLRGGFGQVHLLVAAPVGGGVVGLDDARHASGCDARGVGITLGLGSRRAGRGRGDAVAHGGQAIGTGRLDDRAELQERRAVVELDLPAVAADHPQRYDMERHQPRYRQRQPGAATRCRAPGPTGRCWC